MENAARQLGSFLSSHFEDVKDSFRLRRPSFSPFSAVKQEPLIVVEESGLCEDDEQQSSQDTHSCNRASLDIDSPVNPYLLSPWRDPREVRKHSLPSQQVTEGITASQVRRLSERGEGSGPSPKEAAFLATLSQAPAPSGRRHSVVTISKVPPALFGRNRRESVAAFPLGSRVLQSRRESGASVGPPSTDHLGSIHNLQLDVMDDIVQTRKARMKLWTTSSEKVCEVQTVDEAGTTTGTTQRYTNRRYSDFVGPGGLQPSLSTQPSPSFRRASENPITIVSPCPSTASCSSGLQKKKKTGLLGSRSDLGSIFSNLTSSAMEIHKYSDDQPSITISTSPSTQKITKSNTTSTNSTLDPNIGRSTRSNSFDVSILHNAKQLISDTEDKSATALSGWFKKRHQPIAKKKTIRSKSTAAVALSKDMLERLQNKAEGKENKKQKAKSKWDTKGSMVDAHVIGSAIEGFLRKNTMSHKGAIPKDSKKKQSSGSTSGGGGSSSTSATSGVRSSLNWFTKGDEDDAKDSCDSSLCSTLKDLFVK